MPIPVCKQSVMMLTVGEMEVTEGPVESDFLLNSFPYSSSVPLQLMNRDRTSIKPRLVSGKRRGLKAHAKKRALSGSSFRG
jgi:hypothetical protein